MEKIRTRAEVDQETTWDLKDLFVTDVEWEQELRSLPEAAAQIETFKGRLGEGAEQLLACLDAREALQERIGKTASYARLKQSEDSTNPDNIENSAKAGDILSNLSSSLSFVNSEIVDLPEGTVERYLEELPGLQPYARSLERLIGEKAHRLTPETEKVLASLGEVLDSPYRIYLRGKLADMTFDDALDGEDNNRPLSWSFYENNYEMSSDTKLRRSAYVAFSSTLNDYKNTFAEGYATEVKKQVVLSRLRGYDDVTDMLLSPQQVSKEMYNNILDIIQQELAPHMRRLAALKKRELGLDKLMFCDLKAPLDPEFSPAITYDEACTLIREALDVLGPEYGEIVERAFSERWVDYADNAGKSTGAFCSSIYGSHSYILISWANNMRGAFTLAHEVGHAGHFMLAGRYQRLTNTRPSLYFIEAPSTMNEMLLADHLLKRSDNPRMRRWVILQLLNTYYHNFVTHLLEGELQRRVYALATNDEPITAKTLSQLKGNILSEFWGPDLVIDEGAKLTWMRQPHYYMGLYPYTYAAGLTASTAAAQQIREEGQPAVDRWLEALKAGGSLTPQELMKLAGVDMSGPEPIRSAVAYVGSLVDELERLYS
ncbi:MULTISPECIES: oligoendopeptidase F [unclassified Paenibacillus]|uniref:oligoendopeptidase F n=1 Tax=unclassified Paenibacillus TaxID=185978 RepID=UPI000CFC1C94|nr:MULTISPECIES: oligoendopeptidase F [unclassified Paenibacillus]PRA09562.1 oligoendopeptidase F [Paenibacillus sp. MYb63]PRA46317.1 oligoendopeptidase F [Paenibacillus sp. MYb67]QZN73789.1 oligoendopeptidase F [Paenibacillus sp. DR312]